MLGRALIVWCALAVLAIINGGIRERLLTPRLSPRSGHVVSTLSLCALIGIVAWLTLPWLSPQTHGQAWLVGAAWVLWTVAFEFLAGRYVFGYPWQRLVADYDLRRGRIWVLVLVTNLLAPPTVFSLAAVSLSW